MRASGRATAGCTRRTTTGTTSSGRLFPEDVFGWLDDTQPEELAKVVKPDLTPDDAGQGQAAVLDRLASGDGQRPDERRRHSERAQEGLRGHPGSHSRCSSPEPGRRPEPGHRGAVREEPAAGDAAGPLLEGQQQVTRPGVLRQRHPGRHGRAEDRPHPDRRRTRSRSTSTTATPRASRCSRSAAGAGALRGLQRRSVHDHQAGRRQDTFLPFNAGNDNGAGNAAREGASPTSYLWEQVLRARRLADHRRQVHALPVRRGRGPDHREEVFKHVAAVPAVPPVAGGHQALGRLPGPRGRGTAT